MGLGECSDSEGKRPDESGQIKAQSTIDLWKIFHLFHKEESYALKHLIAVESSNRHVEEKSIQDCCWNVSQRIGQEEERETDEKVRNHARQSRLAHFHDAASSKPREITIDSA